MIHIISMKLEIKNKRILNFYEKNPSLDFENINLLFVEMFENVLSNTDANVSNINSQILNNMYELKNSVSNLQQSIKETQQETAIQLFNKMSELRTGYLEEMKMIIQHNTNENIYHLLEKSNDALIDKTNIIINEIVPKNQHSYYMQIQDSIRTFHKSLSDDTRMLMKYIDSNSIKEYITHFEMKSAMMLQNIQQPIYSCIASSEERIKENQNNHHVTHQKMMNEWNEFIKQYKNSHIEQTPSKMTKQMQAITTTSNLFQLSHIHVILNKMYNTSEVSEIKSSQYNESEPLFMSSIQSQSNIHKEMQTFIMRRPQKPKILIHHIDTETNVNDDHITHFIKTVEMNGCHSVLLSQSSGIVGKPNYHIEIHNKLLVVYIHNVEYMSEKIKVAMDIIDNLSMRMKEISHNDEYSITIEKEILEEINKEYQMFIQHKETMANILKESMKKVFAQMDEFKFPSLEKYLYSKFSTQIQKQGFKCELCKQFLANNLKALAAHKRGCTRKIQTASSVVNGETILST